MELIEVQRECVGQCSECGEEKPGFAFCPITRIDDEFMLVQTLNEKFLCEEHFNVFVKEQKIEIRNSRHGDTQEASYWREELDNELLKELMDTGYLVVSQPPGECSAIDGFLSFDPERLQRPHGADDPLATIAAEMFVRLPWNELDARDGKGVGVREPVHKTIQQLAEHAVADLIEWNEYRLGIATDWDLYELRQATVDVDVVIGRRTTGISPFIGYGYAFFIDSVSGWPSLLHDLAGALSKLEPYRGGIAYAGPVIWVHVTGRAVSVYLTPFDMFGQDFPKQFSDYAEGIPGIILERAGSKVQMPEHAVPVFGLDREDKWVVRFLSPLWWDDRAFATIRSTWSQNADFPIRAHLSEKTTDLESSRFGRIEVHNGLYWFAQPNQLATM